MCKAHIAPATGQIRLPTFTRRHNRSLQFRMSYYNQLHPWHIIHCLPNAQTQTIARFRRRNDAEAHLRVLQQLTPTATYRIVFASAENEPEEKGDRPDTNLIQCEAIQL